MAEGRGRTLNQTLPNAAAAIFGVCRLESELNNIPGISGIQAASVFGCFLHVFLLVHMPPSLFGRVVSCNGLIIYPERP